jgi:Sulfotransferase family
MKRPVFVVGCPRSGTTLLYSMLVAAGGFAIYRKETHFYAIAPRFPNLQSARYHQTFMREFLRGSLGKVPGVDVEPHVKNALGQCTNTGDFLPRLMESITRAQGAERWVEATPTHVLHIKEIKRAVPDALFVHVIRDGRDCAISTDKQRWLGTLPWDSHRSLGVAALYWEWQVRRGRADGFASPGQYIEIRFEDLIADPRVTLRQVGLFIDHDLDYDRILRNPVHSMIQPNTSFRESLGSQDFNPVGRWKDKCSPEDVRLCEMLVGASLRELGYPLAFAEDRRRPTLAASAMRALYPRHFTTKHWLKTRTPLGRMLTKTTLWALQPRANERSLVALAAASVSHQEN